MIYNAKAMDLKLIGNRIRQAREGLHLRQDELAAHLGKTQNSISQYESGERAIRITELPMLAQALNVPISYFFGDEVPEEEAAALIAQLTEDRRKEFLARLRLELELQRQAQKKALTT